MLEVLTRLLDIARPGALFPDIKRLNEWLALSRFGKLRVDVHPVSGFPNVKSLQRLLERQQIAKDWFKAHGATPVKQSEQFNVALAAAELWQPAVEARVVSVDKSVNRLLVVHDRFSHTTGNPVRFTLQVTQKGTRHVRIERNVKCTVTGPFARAIETACDATASAAALRIDALEDLTVTEAVRGELGPCFTRDTQLQGPLGELARAGATEDGILSVLLERVGETVSEDYQADPWPEDDPFTDKRAAKGWHLARDRKLVCTPLFDEPLKALARGTRMMVRSR